MKIRGLIFVSCLAAGALLTSPAIAKPAKKSSMSTSKRVAPQTTQMTRHNQNISPRMGNTRYYGTRSYAVRQYTGTRYYGGTGYYGNNYYGGVSRYSYGGGYPNYGYSSGWPYSNWGYGTSGYYPYSYYGGYPYSGYNNYYSYYGGYPYGTYNNNSYSYYTPSHSYNGSMVAAVQGRLSRLGYYHGAVDGVMGPQTRNAIAAFESRNGLGVDGTISRPLLNRLGLA
jgi:Putative peptidoglycan binding domain